MFRVRRGAAATVPFSSRPATEPTGGQSVGTQFPPVRSSPKNVQGQLPFLSHFSSSLRYERSPKIAAPMTVITITRRTSERAKKIASTTTTTATAARTAAAERAKSTSSQSGSSAKIPTRVSVLPFDRFRQGLDAIVRFEGREVRVTHMKR